MNRVEDGKFLILYDGVCGLCDASVRFFIKNDTKDRLRFAPLQGDLARDIVARQGGDPDDLATVYLVANAGQPEERAWKRGPAALKILLICGGFWRVLTPFSILPDSLLNAGYRIVARVRYLIAGRKELCELPTAVNRHRFLDTPAHESDGGPPAGVEIEK
ncbi:MAG: DCC1-like thiol-disulfide oxidoreductase family protein [Planctomycetota bacterium]